LKRYLNVIVFCIFLLLGICISSFQNQIVYALDKSTAKTKGLTLSPLRSELGIAPGTSVDGTLTVTNSTTKDMAVDLNAEEFKVVNQQYDYAFTPESDLSKWVTFELSNINLAKGDTKKVKFTVSVPLSAEPGGRYISLFASTNTGSSINEQESRQRIASLLYITVLGDVTRSGHVVSLSSPWFIGENSNWSVVLQNTGTTHFRSRYFVRIINLITDGTAANASGGALILPGSVRLVPDTLPTPIFPGIYKAVFTIGLGDTPAKIETRLVLYMPIYFTAIILILIASIGVKLLLPKKRLKSRKNKT